MKLIFCFVALSILGLLSSIENVAAQQQLLKDQLIGHWTFVSNSVRMPDGSPEWGNNPMGSLIFGADGRYSLQIMRSDRAKFASNDRMKSTPDENRATVQGTLTHFGKWSVNEPEKIVTFHIVSSSYPNWNRIDQPRLIKAIKADELEWTNPKPSAGSASVNVVWRRTR